MEVSLEKKLELIDKISFFGRFDKADRATIANLAYFEAYQPQTKLIEQGTINSKLCFIINGNVDIVIDGAVVVSLSGGGHVFGEMSFVDFSPASASVVASTKVTAMQLDTAKINLMIEPTYFRLRMEVYRSCAEILARRLIHTNAMAKTYLQK